MHSSYAMMASRVTPLAKEEGAEVNGVEWARGVAISVRGHFDRSWALLCLMNTALIAPMMEK